MYDELDNELINDCSDSTLDSDDEAFVTDYGDLDDELLDSDSGYSHTEMLSNNVGFNFVEEDKVPLDKFLEQ